MNKLHSPLAYAVVAAALTSASAALALGLGEASISSKLGQPLEARIPLNELAGLSDNQLVVKVDAVWDDVTGTAMGGVDPRQLLLETVIDSAGSGVLRLRTRQPLTEPFLNFVVTVRWPDGVISREYTLLLDLPSQQMQPSAVGAERGDATTELGDAAKEQIVGAAARSPVPSAANTGVPATGMPATGLPATNSTEAETPSRALPPARGEAGRYTTRRGDSLWAIASALRTSLGGTIKQRMAKVYASNPEAFVGGDPARLKEQVVLDINIATLSAAPAELPQLERANSASPFVENQNSENQSSENQASKSTAATNGRSAPSAPLFPSGGPNDDGAGEDKLNAIRREISQVTEAMAEMSDKLADLQRQLREVSQQQSRADGAGGVVAENSTPEADEASPVAGPDTQSQQAESDSAGQDDTAGAGDDSAALLKAAEVPGEDRQTANDSQLRDIDAQGSVADAAPASDDRLAVKGGDSEARAAIDSALVSESASEDAPLQQDARQDGSASSLAWLRWLALPVLAILALLWWRQRRGDAKPVHLATAERDREAEPEWMVSAPRARPRAPASEEFGELFSELAQENRRDLPGTTSQHVRSAIEAEHSVASAPAAPSSESETPAPRRSAFDHSDFTETSPTDADSVFADLEDGLSDLDFDDIDLNEQSADMPLVDDAKSVGERAAACMALSDFNGAREILEAALQHSTDVGLQLQLLDVYAAQDESAEFEALALQMEFAGADDNTLAEIQLIRDKLNGAVDNGDYNGHSA